MKALPYTTYKLTIVKYKKVIHEGSYAFEKQAKSTISGLIGFSLNKKELEALKQYGVCYKHHSPRMGAYTVRLKKEFNKPLGSTYFHINNGGVSFETADRGEFGVTVKVRASHFGHETSNIELMTDLYSLKELQKMITKAVGYFKKKAKIKEYCCKAGVNMYSRSNSSKPDAKVESMKQKPKSLETKK